MVGHGNRSVEAPHYDNATLEAYVLGQLVPDEETAIRQHLADCPDCQTAVAAYQAFCQSVDAELHRVLDRATPSPDLSFDRVAEEWRKPPRRVTIGYRLGRLVPGVSTAIMIVLFAVAVVAMVPSSELLARRSLDLTSDYDGPAALVAAATEDGIAIVQLDEGDTRILRQLPHINGASNLQFSPDGGWLALQQGQTLHIVEVQPTGVHVKLALRESADWSWSPDNRTLAYTDGRGRLVVFDVQTQTHDVLVPAQEHAWGQPVWSADGAEIAYAVAAAHPGDTPTAVAPGIWQVNPATGYRVELARTPSDEVLLVPTAWTADDTIVLAWDAEANAQGQRPALYRIVVAERLAEPLSGTTLAQGNRLAWPVSAQGRTLVLRQDRLVVLQFGSRLLRTIPDQVPWPNAAEWAPGGAWLAYVVSGQPEGEGVYLYAPNEGRLRPVTLPAGAAEKAVYWAGPENLFVVRQPRGSDEIELWLVSLTSDDPPQRLIGSVSLPQTSASSGWRWQDVITTRVLGG